MARGGGGGIRLARLYYQLEMEVDNYVQGIKDAEKASTRFHAFVMKHPVAAAGALTAALAAVGVAAGKMAAEVDRHMRRAAASMPALRDRMKEVTKEVVDLSKQTPRTAAELAQAFGEIAKSTKDPDEAMRRLRASTIAADAAGIDLAVTYQGLDSVLDAFNLSGKNSEEVLARIFSVAQGRVELDELFQVLQKNGAELHRMGFGLDEAAIRLVALLDAGVPAKGIMTQFKAVTKEVTGQTVDAAKALRDMGEAAAFTREGSENLVKILKNELSAHLIELGTKILPGVNYGLQAMIGLFATFDGTVANIKANSATATIAQLAETLKKATGDAVTRDVLRLKDAVTDLGRAWNNGFSLMANLTERDIATMTTDQVHAMQKGMILLDQFREQAQLTDAQQRAVLHNMLLLGRAAAARPQTTTSTQGLAPAGKPTFQPIDPELEKKKDDLVRDAQDALVKMTGSVSQAVNLEITRILERAHEVFGEKIPAVVQQWIDGLREQLATDQIFEGFQQQLDKLTQESEAGADALKNGYAGAIAEASDKLRSLQTLVQGELNTTSLTNEQRERLKKLLAEIEVQLHANAAAAGKSVKAAKDENAEREKALAKAKELGRQIENYASGVLQVAEAWGLADERSSRVLRNAIELASSLPAALKGDPSAIFNALASGISLIKNVFGAGDKGGKNKEIEQRAAEDARRFQEQQLEILRRLEAITREFTKTVGELGVVNAPGGEFASARNDLQKVIEFLLTKGLGGNQSLSQVFGMPEGVDLVALSDTLKGLGFDVDVFTTDLGKLQEVLKALNAVELTQFAETFAGQLDALRARLELFDISDPLAQLGELVKLFNDPKFGAPALREALAGLDLTTPEGRAAAKAAIQQLFTALQAGTLDPSQLGGLTAQQLLEQLLNINRILGGAGAAAGETQQFSVERKITEVQADRLIAIETTGLAILTEQLQVAKDMKALLMRIAPAPVSLNAPSLSSLNGMGSGLSITIAPGAVVVHAGPNADAAAIAQAVGQSLGALIANQLEAATRSRTTAAGAGLVS